jgi:gluconokinase
MPRVVVMGVSGSGKSTVGALLAHRLQVDYAEADDFHTDAARAKLHAGIALTDEERQPWLDALASWLARHPDGGVATCSALKRRYRDTLRKAAPDVVFLYCKGSRELIAERIAARKGHFMSPSLLQSQFDDLEPPGADERAVTADVAQPPAEIVERFLAAVNPKLHEPER